MKYGRSLLFMILLPAIAVVSGCVSQPLTTQGVAADVRRSESKFDVLGTVTGPEVFEMVPRGILNDHLRWRVQASTIKDGSAVGAYRLIASVWHQDQSWRTYRSASFVGGLNTAATRVDAKPSCMAGGGYVSCSFTEIVSVPIPSELWAKARTEGIEIRLNAARGPDVVVKVPTAYVVGFEEGARRR